MTIGVSQAYFRESPLQAGLLGDVVTAINGEGNCDELVSVLAADYLWSFFFKRNFKCKNESHS